MTEQLQLPGAALNGEDKPGFEANSSKLGTASSCYTNQHADKLAMLKIRLTAKVEPSIYELSSRVYLYTNVCQSVTASETNTKLQRKVNTFILFCTVVLTGFVHAKMIDLHKTSRRQEPTRMLCFMIQG